MTHKIRHVPLDHLHLESFDFQNPRVEIDGAALRQLADDIHGRGLLNALLAWEIDDEAFIVLGGQRRVRALHLLATEGKLPENFLVPINIVEGVSAEDAMAVALADNVHREQLSTYDQAVALSKMPGTVPEIAARVGLSVARVSQLITSYNSSTDEMREAWRTKRLSEEKVRSHAQRPPDQQRDVLAGRPVPVLPKPHVVPGPTALSEGRRGPARGKRPRPSAGILRQAIKALDGRVTTPYEEGALDMLKYAVDGEVSSDSRWVKLTSQNAIGAVTRGK